MQGGVQLSLRIGPVPLPAPRELVDALVHAKVEDGSGGTQSGFELTFELPARSPLRTLFLLTGGGSLPLMRVVLVVTINGGAAVDHRRRDDQRRNAAGPGRRRKARRQGQGSVRADGHHRDARPAVSRRCRRRARVLLVLAKYAAFGVIPMVIPSILDVPPLPMQQIPQQRGSDYAY